MMISWRESFMNEFEKRISIEPANICTFGVKPLDDALIGFLPNDLIVIAADSGTGKSQVGLDIALHNAMQGRKVALYSIEGNDEAAIARIKWKYMRQLYYQKHNVHINFDFRKWSMNMDQGNKEIVELEQQALRFMEDKIGDRLSLYHMENSFTLHDFQESLKSFGTDRPNVDLIVIDHLQYFTFEDPGNELAETTDILKVVKNICDHQNIPVLLISHLRKKDKNRGLPNQEDLFGTSNIVKICSQCIVIAPCYTNVDYVNDIYPTFFRFVKSRTGLKANYAIVSDFHFRSGSYDQKYKMYYLKDNVATDEFKRHQLPNWAYKSPLATTEEA